MPPLTLSSALSKSTPLSAASNLSQTKLSDRVSTLLLIEAQHKRGETIMPCCAATLRHILASLWRATHISNISSKFKSRPPPSSSSGSEKSCVLVEATSPRVKAVGQNAWADATTAIIATASFIVPGPRITKKFLCSQHRTNTNKYVVCSSVLKKAYRLLRTPTVSYRFPDLLTQHDVTPMTTQPEATTVSKPLINYQFIDYHYS